MNEPKQDSLAPKDLKFSAFDLPPGVGESRLKSRRQLLSKLDNNSTSPYLGSRWDNMSETAATMITSEKCTKAFDLTREDPRLRDHYGRNEYSQSFLLARRLVESGVRFVNVF